jgi:hypothetical protein
MNAKYWRSRFCLPAGTWIYKREIELKQLLNSSLIFFVAMLFLIFTGTNVMAGGLVDTSLERFQDAVFTNNSAVIDNPWWPSPAGHNFLYFAQDGEDCLWNLTEALGTTADLGGDFFDAYAGTNARVVLDRGWVDEGCAYGLDFQAFMGTNPEVEESTYDWYAQDSENNIWYMGEDTFDGVDFAGSFTAGCDGAEPGIVVLGNPSKGDFYRQEFYEGVAEDWAKVLNFSSQDGLICMTTKEWSPLEYGAIEHKLYCNGAVGGLSRIVELKGKNVIWELVANDLEETPQPPAGPISPIPDCPPFQQP